jgi:putative proteasome-type protease
MTYCLGIRTREGLVLASDSRTNAGLDQINVCCKMHSFVMPGERMFSVLSSGSLSLTQSIVTRIRHEFREGRGLAEVETFYDAARCVGQHIREISDIDRDALEKDNVPFSVNFLVGGQIGDEPPQLYMIYSTGNPLRCTRSAPFLQIGETKYGRPILDRGIQFDETTLEQAVKYAVISLDSTMRSNVTVGPPIDMLVYRANDLSIRSYRRFMPDDEGLTQIRSKWDQGLRTAIADLPTIAFSQTGDDVRNGSTCVVEPEGSLRIDS